MICSLCHERRPDAETLGHHLMRDHGITQLDICPSWGLGVTYETHLPR